MTDYLRQKGTEVYRKDLFQLVQKIPASNVVNYVFKNKNGIQFENMQNSWGINLPSNSNGAAYADLDNDGDLDLVVNNVNDTAFIFKNNASEKVGTNYIKVKLRGADKNTQGVGAKVFVYSKGTTQLVEQMMERGFQSSISPIIHFGLGSVKLADSIKIQWPSGLSETMHNVRANQSLTVHEKKAMKSKLKTESLNVIFSNVNSPIEYQQLTNTINDYKRQPLLVNPLSFQGPYIKKIDIDKDGLDDVFVGGGVGESAQIFMQSRNGNFKSTHHKVFDIDKNSTDTDAAFFDANGDGRTDIYITSGGYHKYVPGDSLLQDRVYLNNGKDHFSKSSDALPKNFSSNSCVRVSDINGDGYQDLFVGGRVVPGRYPEIPRSGILINDGNGHFVDQTTALAPEINQLGMVTEAVWIDLNGDGSEDLIVVGEWMPITVFINTSGKLINSTSHYFDKEYTGWWNTINTGDYNGDGITDIIVGNMGLNTQYKVSYDQPAELYYKDYDNNGAIDPIFCFYTQNVSYPYISRDELLYQLPMMRTRFPNYKSYADAGMKDIFTPRESNNQKFFKAICLETVLFTGSQDSQFVKTNLPLQAQFAPIFSITNIDFDGDNDMDLLLCGNINNARLRFGNSDANYGVLLENDGNGNFSYINQQRSGLNLKGDVRSAVVLSDHIIFGINQKPVQAYKLQK